MEPERMRRFIVVLRYVLECISLMLEERKRFLRRRVAHRRLTVYRYLPYLHLRSSAGRDWMKIRSKKLWSSDVPNFSDLDWISNFRVRKATFLEIVAIVQEDMSPDQMSVREPICTEERVAIALYKLASAAELRTVANLFGVGISTVQKFLAMFCDSICRQLNRFITPPSEAEAKAIAARIERKFGFPQVYGCIDGCHIPVSAPSDGKQEYQNRKGHDSMLLQAVVDDSLCFWDVSIKFPGGCHDAYAFANSKIYEKQDLLPKAPVEIEGTLVPLCILADPAYPLLPWVMKRFTGANLPPDKDSFNCYLSSVRVMVEHAFGKLKARWRITSKKIDTNISFVPKIVATCCALHNLCERANTPVLVEWRDGIQEHSSNVAPDAALETSSPPDGGAIAVRQAIVDHLIRHHPLRSTARRR